MNTIKQKSLSIIVLFILIAILAVIMISPNENTEDGKTKINNENKMEEITFKYKGFDIDALINRPASTDVDALLLFHGTTLSDEKSKEGAEKLFDLGENIQGNRDDLLIISIAYKESDVLIGDEIPESEAALLWLKEKAGAELGLNINKIHMLGHSRGGYIVTRLNNLHETDGVIANAPGPIDFNYRCELEENGTIKKDPSNIVCQEMRRLYGSTKTNPEEYDKRSLINNIDSQKSKLLLIQGLADSPLQIELFPELKEGLNNCSNCEDIEILELPGIGHVSFTEPEVIDTIREFIK